MHEPPARGQADGDTPRHGGQGGREDEQVGGMDAGADLVQGYTAFLYRGPLWARGINRGLAAAPRPGARRR